MPHSRLQRTSFPSRSSCFGADPLPLPSPLRTVAPELIVNGKKVEEAIVAGDGGSAVYWRILNP